MNEYAKRFIRESFFEILFSIPKTIWFNFRILPFKEAIRMPFAISYHIRTKGINKNTFVVEKRKMPTASVRIGFGASINARRETKKGLIQISNNGKIVLKGIAGLSQGVILSVDNCVLTLGECFRCNYSTTIDCTGNDVIFGDDVVCGWNVTIRNGDGHNIIQNGMLKNKTAPIKVGNHVWLCANSTIMKGTNIGDDSVVAYGSILSKANGENNVLYAGVPAKIIKQNINWEE